MIITIKKIIIKTLCYGFTYSSPHLPFNWSVSLKFCWMPYWKPFSAARCAKDSQGSLLLNQIICKTKTVQIGLDIKRFYQVNGNGLKIELSVILVSEWNEIWFVWMCLGWFKQNTILNLIDTKIWLLGQHTALLLPACRYSWCPHLWFQWFYVFAKVWRMHNSLRCKASLLDTWICQLFPSK